MKHLKTFESAYKTINEPEIGSIVRYNGGYSENVASVDVWIVSGEYLSSTIIPGESQGRISNHWSWRRVLEDGTLSKEDWGYGDFTYSDIVEYKIWIEEEIKEIYPIKLNTKKYNL